jgi:hypothetical protein
MSFVCRADRDWGGQFPELRSSHPDVGDRTGMESGIWRPGRSTVRLKSARGKQDIPRPDGNRPIVHVNRLQQSGVEESMGICTETVDQRHYGRIDSFLLVHRRRATLAGLPMKWWGVRTADSRSMAFPFRGSATCADLLHVHNPDRVCRLFDCCTSDPCHVPTMEISPRYSPRWLIRKGGIVTCPAREGSTTQHPRIRRPPPFAATRSLSMSARIPGWLPKRTGILDLDDVHIREFIRAAFRWC